MSVNMYVNQTVNNKSEDEHKKGLSLVPPADRMICLIAIKEGIA
jgi:hypothetical protein